MSSDLALLAWALVLASGAGYIFAYYYGKDTKDFRWREYIAFIIIPIVVIALMGLKDPRIPLLYGLSMLVGALFELVMGFLYHRILGHRLWTYHRHSIGGYTSWLAVPMWGIAGVVFWFLAKSLGL